MDVRQPPRRTRSRARERVNARRARQMASATPINDRAYDEGAPVQSQPSTRRPNPARREIALPASSAVIRERAQRFARDAWWYTLHRPYVLQGIFLFIIAVFATFIVSHMLSGRLYPNIWALSVNLGDMTAEEAVAALERAWVSEIKIALTDEDRVWEVRPGDLGLDLDAEATVEAARGVGMAGIPMGYSIAPVVNVDLFAAQDYLLNLTDEANYAPQNATFRWDGTQLVGVDGSYGRVLDVGMSMERLKADPARIVEKRRFDLEMQALEPQVLDPAPYLDEANKLIQQPLEMVGYDPFRNDFMSWSTDQATMATWLEVNDDGLGLREDAYAPFLDALNDSLRAVNELRYLESTETMETVEEALRNGQSRVDLRIRYRPTEYTVVSGDTGYKIARRNGLPFYLVTSANPEMDWDELSVGDTVMLPSRDLTVPLDPVPRKRIVVDLETQALVAYEDGQEVFQWRISSGISDFPTYPGVFQILTHNESAFGSTFELCSSSGCGQWEMFWFMGIYEVVPGLMNGFHGAVLLPNGAYLGGGNVGRPYTYGCVMSENSNAEALYQWADQGTVVEILSSDYEPASDLGAAAREELQFYVQ